ncbi:MAG: AMP-binding protein [Abditibacteriota bacterium]|nr:AMP-binding protein [Abditibacteriota bacterium]
MKERYLEECEFSSYEDMRNRFRFRIPDNFNFGFDVVDAWADEEPEKRALVWANPQGEERTFTFTDIKRLSNQTVNYLKRVGVKKGDVVMLVLKRRWEYWVISVACHKLGAIALPVNHLMKKKDFSYRISKARVSCVFCVNEEMAIRELEESIAHDAPHITNKIVVQSPREGWAYFDDCIAGESDVFERPTGAEATQNDDTMLMYFTSGTTGMPKLLPHNYLYPLGHIITACYWQCVQNNGLHLTVADTGWAKTGWGKIYGQWIGGTANMVYDFDRFHADEILSLIEKYKLTTFCAPPTVYRFIIKEDLSKYDFSSLTHCCTAGEALHSEVFNAFEKATGHKIYEGFGQSEGVVLLATFPGVTPRPGSMGKPSPAYDIRLLDENLKEVEVGQEGLLAVKVDDEYPVGLFKGYLFDLDDQEERFRGGYYFTGDMAWRDEMGYYWFVGRSDDVIKSSGYRIGPFEIESVLMQHPSVLECAVTGAPDPIRGQVVKATIKLAKGYEPSDELSKELQEFVKKNTAPYKYPRLFDYVDELPKTFSGKIRRKVIRERDNMDTNPNQ